MEEGKHFQHFDFNIIKVINIITTVITMMITIMIQVNSLAHYGVKEKALVSLVPKQIDSPSHHIYQVLMIMIMHQVGHHIYHTMIKIIYPAES